MSTVRHCICNDDSWTFIIQDRDDGDDAVYHRKWNSLAEYDAHMAKVARITKIRARLDVVSPFHPFYDDVSWLLDLVEATNG